MSAQLNLVLVFQQTLSRAVVLLRIAPPRHTPGERPLDHVPLAELPQLSVAVPG